MAYNSECEGCEISVHLTAREIEDMFGAARVKNVKTVSEREYTRRMDICGACECLLYGTTCRHCGCVVQVKAKLATAKCPFPYSPKW